LETGTSFLKRVTILGGFSQLASNFIEASRNFKKDSQN
jgi:hypothetical protein